ncbi:MAG TPA: histidine kinase N-terminal 7TM domain-containing protein [Roseococcus sp.]|jgi:signal transduction histidine kinase|nr:histidine kinase N-terminal 7TM domain-containing protein [Roseococcus sp.]
MLTGCAFDTPGGAELLVISVWLGVATVTGWVLRQHPFFGRPHFILCNFAILWWLAMVLGELATPVLGCKMFFAAAAWPSIALLPTAWALFLLHYCFHMPIRHPGAEVALLWGTVLAVSLMAWTNPWHGLFYGPGTSLAWVDGRLSGVFDHGPLFYIAAAWLYVPLLTALGVVVTGAFRAPVAHRPYFLLLLFITAIPLAANFAYITHRATVAGFDPTPFAFAVVLVLYTGLIFTNRMFDLTAIARDVLYYQLGSPVLVLDVAGTVTGANPEAMRLFPGGRVGQPIWQWPHLQGFGAAAEGLDAPQSLGFDGRFFDVTTTPIHKPLGQGRGVIGAVILLNDTTELRRNARQLETALEVSQLRLHEIENQRRLLRNLFDLAPFGVTLVETPNGRLREVNPAFASMTAQSAAPGERLPDLLSDPGRLALAEAATLPEGGRVGPVVAEIRRRDGGYVMVELQAVAAGAGLYWTILTDLTETRALQEALQVERDFLSRLMATSVSAILAVDEDRQIVFANAEAERLLEMDRATLLATRINDPGWHYTTPEGGPMAQEDLPFPVVMRTGRPVRDLRLGVEGPDGRRRILSVNAAPMHATALTPGRVVLSLTDITAQWEVQAALVAARQEAEAASIAKSRFLANMSHEIRTPMNAILGLLALLRRTSLDARQADYVGKTEGAARALLGLLNDILDFSKVEAGKIALDPRPVSLDAMLRELGVILAANLGAKPIELLFDMDPRLPTQVLVDDLRLAQVLLNLAGNAIKFTEAGEVVVSVRLLAREAGRASLEFAVRDSGIGIAADNMPRIFEGFLQAEASTTRKFGGTGLGLGISQRLVVLLGGELRVESTPGQGSRFHFALDLELPEAPARLPGPVKRLLFVEPHPVARDILPRLAARLGWRAEAVADLAAARVRREAQRFDAVLVEGLRPDTPEAGWEGVLGMGTVHDCEGYVAAGGPPGRFLVKPFTPAQLRELVDGAGALPPPRRSPRGHAPPGRPAPAAGGGQCHQPAGGARAAGDRGRARHRRGPWRHRGAAPRGDAWALRSGVDGPADAGDGRAGGDGADPRPAWPPATAHHRHHRQCHAQRPRCLPGRGHERPCRQALRPGDAGADPALLLGGRARRHAAQRARGGGAATARHSRRHRAPGRQPGPLHRNAARGPADDGGHPRRHRRAMGGRRPCRCTPCCAHAERPGRHGGGPQAGGVRSPAGGAAQGTAGGKPGRGAGRTAKPARPQPRGAARVAGRA